MKRQLVSHLQKFGLKLSQALKLVEMPKKGSSLAQKIKDLAFRYPSFGYPRIWALLRKENLCINLKRVRRIYKKLNLELSISKAKRRS
jgi:hypothetical protein